eukprot:COSAG02_NODE_3582_length_6531_cov_4.696206_9_plen_428_part_00
MAFDAASNVAAEAQRGRRTAIRAAKSSSSRRSIAGDPAAAEFEFGPGPLGIAFTAAVSGLPLRIDRIVAGSQAEQMVGLEIGAALYTVNGTSVGERPHAEVVAMVKAACDTAAAAQPAGSAPVQLSFLAEEEQQEAELEVTSPTSARPAPAVEHMSAGASQGWIAKLAGEWEASGQVAGEPDQVETEWLLLEVSPSGQLSGLVDDGDGVLDSGDCRIENSHCVVENDTCHVAFDQRYNDGAVTRWECEYSKEQDMLVAGRWEGDVSGTFQARRRRTEPSRTSVDHSVDDQFGENVAVAQAFAAGSDRISRFQEHRAHDDQLTPIRRMSTGSDATSPFAVARDELESLTRGAASLLSEAERDLEESAARVAELETMIAERDTEVRKLTQALIEKDATVREKDEQLEQQDKRLTQLSTALKALAHDGLS